MSLINALKSYTQCDLDGVMCKVSRQAVHEAIERIVELEAQRQEDADLIEAQKREIEVLHGIRDEAERLREEVEQLQWTIKDMTVYSTGGSDISGL